MLRLATLAAAAVLATSAALPAWALDCPKPQPTAKPGILKETPAQMTAVGKQLASGDTFNAIASATACSTSSMPHSSPARGASVSAIVVA